jgi:hypothetical protein
VWCTTSLTRSILETINKRYPDDNSLAAAIAKYYTAYKNVFVGPQWTRQSIIETLVEEIFADAYAGINSFGVDTSRYAETAARYADAAAGVARAETAAATERTTGPPEGEKFSVGETREGEPVAVIDRDILDGVSPLFWIKTVKDNIRRRFPEGVKIANSQIKINSMSINEIFNSEYSNRLKVSRPLVFADKIRSTDSADDILKAARNWIDEGVKHPRRDNFVSFARGNVLLSIGDNNYSSDVVVGHTSGGNDVLYDILNLKPANFAIKQKSDSENGRPIQKGQPMLEESDSGKHSAGTTAVPLESGSAPTNAVLDGENIPQGAGGVNSENAENSGDGGRSGTTAPTGDVLTRENIERNRDKLPKYSIAYHGTPYSFDEFLLEHIGEGEGAQAHGYGLYFAADKTVAERYRDLLGDIEYYADDEKLVDKYEEKMAIEILNDRPYPFNSIEERINAFRTNSDFDRAYERIKDKKIEMRNSGNVYTVDIPDEDVMLNEDLELDDQPEKVQAAFEVVASMDDERLDKLNEFFYLLDSGGDLLGDYPTGRHFYNALARDLGKAEASKFLNDIGIKGVVYRGGQDGKAYVVFDDKAIKILSDAEEALGGVRYSLRPESPGARILSVSAAEPRSTSDDIDSGNGTEYNSLSNREAGNALLGYTERERENWADSKNIVLYNDAEQLRQFVRESADGGNRGKKLYFGKIPQNLAEKIMNETGAAVGNFNVTLRADEILKILKAHGTDKTEAPRGQRAIALSDFEDIPEIIQNADSIKLSPKLFEGKPVLLFEKELRGRTAIVS